MTLIDMSSTSGSGGFSVSVVSENFLGSQLEVWKYRSNIFQKTTERQVIWPKDLDYITQIKRVNSDNR